MIDVISISFFYLFPRRNFSDLHFFLKVLLFRTCKLSIDERMIFLCPLFVDIILFSILISCK